MIRSAAIFFLLLSAPFLRAAEFETERLPEEVGKETPFLNSDYLVARVGSGAASNDKRLPLLIFLHGAGGRGTDIERIKRNANPALSGAEKWAGEPFLLVAPQAGPPTKEVEVTWILEELDRWLGHLKETHPIDESRIYLTGVSMGGFGTWAWAAHSPEHFAAVVPIVGGLGFGGPKDITPDLDQWAENLSAIPAWCFHGAKDTVVPADRSERMIELIREKGGRQAKLTIYPEEGHGAAGRVYASEEMFRWMFAQRQGRQALVPDGWDPALAGDLVMERLVTVTAPQVKGAHDAEMAIVDGHAYVVAEVDDEQSGESAARAQIYSTLSIVDLDSLEVEAVEEIARGEQVFENTTLPKGAVFVPRIYPISKKTLRCWFASERPGERQSQTWYRDFDLETRAFASTINEAKLKTVSGVFPMQPIHFHADAAAQGFEKPAKDFGLYLFDSFKVFDGKTYVAINNFPGKQNALALVHDDFATFEILGHYNEPQSAQLSESAVNRLPDGTWMAICRNDGGNYHFTTSEDGRDWTVGRELPHIPNGANSKPTFDKFGDLYYLGWQEATRIHGVNRSVFNVDISRDGAHWERKYRFESTRSFQYPTFRENDGVIWLTVTQGDTSASRKERIMFGRLEDTGAFPSQEGLDRKPIPVPSAEPAVMKPGTTLFTDRNYAIEEVPDELAGLPFLRTTIDDFHARIENDGVLYALTPPETIENAASREKELRDLGFERTDLPVFELFPGAINHVCTYRKQVKAGDRFHFRKVVLLVAGEGAKVVGSSESPR